MMPIIHSLAISVTLAVDNGVDPRSFGRANSKARKGITKLLDGEFSDFDPGTIAGVQEKLNQLEQGKYSSAKFEKRGALLDLLSTQAFAGFSESLGTISTQPGGMQELLLQFCELIKRNDPREWWKLCNAARGSSAENEAVFAAAHAEQFGRLQSASVDTLKNSARAMLHDSPALRHYLGHCAKKQNPPEADIAAFLLKNSPISLKNSPISQLHSLLSPLFENPEYLHKDRYRDSIVEQLGSLLHLLMPLSVNGLNAWQFFSLASATLAAAQTGTMIVTGEHHELIAAAKLARELKVGVAGRSDVLGERNGGSTRLTKMLYHIVEPPESNMDANVLVDEVKGKLMFELDAIEENEFALQAAYIVAVEQLQFFCLVVKRRFTSAQRNALTDAFPWLPIIFCEKDGQVRNNSTTLGNYKTMTEYERILKLLAPTEDQ